MFDWLWGQESSHWSLLRMTVFVTAGSHCKSLDAHVLRRPGCSPAREHSLGGGACEEIVGPQTLPLPL